MKVKQKKLHCGLLLLVAITAIVIGIIGIWRSNTFFRGFLLSTTILVDSDNQAVDSAIDGSKGQGSGQQLDDEFTGKALRKYMGALHFASSPEALTRDNSWFRRMAKDCQAWVVALVDDSTSNNSPKASIALATRLKEYCMVIVGRRTRKPADWQLLKDQIVYLSLTEQKKIKHGLVNKISCSSLALKNIGYLFAIRHGAKVIFDYDPGSNILMQAPPFNVNTGENPMPVSPFSLKTLDLNQILVRHSPDVDKELVGKVFNPYPLMNPSKPNVWPRGFPITNADLKNARQDGTPAGQEVAGASIKTSAIGVIQSLCNVYPDVDAIYHILSKHGSVTFDTSSAATKLLVPPQSFAPYNAQASVHMYNAFWALLLPSTVSSRVSDIWRSYVAQRIFQDLNLVVLYAPPVVTGLKDYSMDFDLEKDLFEQTSHLLKFLTSWEAKQDSLPAYLEQMYIALYERYYIDLADVEMMQEWLDALLCVGYEFPTIISGEEKERRMIPIINQPMLHGQPFQVYPYFNTGGPSGDLTYPQYLSSKGLNKHGSTESTWQEWLGGVDRSKGPKQGVLKLVMMTKDEWPILKKWVVYHGALIGFENLYIIDGSKDLKCIWFLKQMRDAFGVQVIFSPANLNELTNELTYIGNWIRGSSDITMKVDTDEFLVVKTNSTTCINQEQGDCTLSPYAVPSYLASWENLVAADGRRLRVGHVQGSIPSQELCDPQRTDDDLGEYGLSPNEGAGGFKVVKDSRSIHHYDLGGHVGGYYPPMQDLESQYTEISILHYHYRCLETEIENSLKACIGHNYITENDVKAGEEGILAHLRQFTRPSHDPRLCEEACGGPGMASCHKVTHVASYLSCKENYTRGFYPPAQSLRKNPDFKQFLGGAMDAYATVSDIAMPNFVNQQAGDFDIIQTALQLLQPHE